MWRGANLRTKIVILTMGVVLAGLAATTAAFASWGEALGGEANCVGRRRPAATVSARPH